MAANVASPKTAAQIVHEAQDLLSARNRAENPDRIEQARLLFAQAVEQDPNSAKAWAGLAKAYALQVGYATMDIERATKKAQEARDRAVQLDEHDLDVMNTALMISHYLELNPPQAEHWLKKLLQKTPNDPVLHWKQVELAAYDGRLQEAKNRMGQVEEAFPDSATDARRAWFLFLLGDYSASYQRAKSLVEKEPENKSAYFHVSRAAAQLGRFDEAMDWLAHVGADKPTGNPARYSEYLSYLALNGQADLAEKKLTAFLGRSEITSLTDYKLAQVYAALNNKTETLKHLQKAVDEKEFLLLFLPVDPMFASLSEAEIARFRVDSN